MSGRGDIPPGRDQFPVAFIPSGDGLTDMVAIARQIRGGGGPVLDATADWIERLAPVYLAAWENPKSDGEAWDDLMGQAVAVAMINHFAASGFMDLTERRAARAQLIDTFSTNLVRLGEDFDRMPDDDPPPAEPPDDV